MATLPSSIAGQQVLVRQDTAYTILPTTTLTLDLSAFTPTSTLTDGNTSVGVPVTGDSTHYNTFYFVYDFSFPAKVTNTSVQISGSGPVQNGKLYTSDDGITFTYAPSYNDYNSSPYALIYNPTPSSSHRFLLFAFNNGGYYGPNIYQEWEVTANFPGHVTPGPDISTSILAALTSTSLCNPAAIPPATPPALPSLFLSLDAHRRPIAAGRVSGVATGYYSNDGGHSFASAVIDSATTCTDISLLIDRSQNRFCALYSKGAAGSTGLYSAFGPVLDSFTPDAAPAAISGLSGAYPIAAQHETDRLFYLLAYLDGGTLKAAESGDGGQSWAAQGTIAAGLSFTATGRAGLCFLSESAFCAYGSGSSLLCQSSPDRGVTWGSAVRVAAAGPYSGLSLLGWQGRLYLLAFAGTTPAPHLFVSADLGATWTEQSSGLPAISPPSAIGIIPLSSQHRLGITHHSDNDGATWVAN